jgi:hypothetical protein
MPGNYIMAWDGAYVPVNSPELFEPIHGGRRRKNRKTRRSRRRGGEYVVPKQVMPANENVDPLNEAKAALKPSSLRILKPKQQSVSEVQVARSNLSSTPKSPMVYGMSRRRKTRRTRRHR